jgi:hypothetical protein
MSRLSAVKGLMSSVEYFFKAFTIKSVLSVQALMVFKFLACVVQEEHVHPKDRVHQARLANRGSPSE